MRRLRPLSAPLAIVGVVALAAALGSGHQKGRRHLGPQPDRAAPAAHSGCHVRGELPDRHCTPGATDPAVSQRNIARTICVPGYTRSVRPPLTFTEPLKRELISAYGAYAGRSLRAYEADHLIPLELGGAPRAVANIWPESDAGSLASHAKDSEEDLLHREVCDGRLALRTAQREMADDWVAAYRGDHPGR